MVDIETTRHLALPDTGFETFRGILHLLAILLVGMYAPRRLKAIWNHVSAKARR